MLEKMEEKNLEKVKEKSARRCNICGKIIAGSSFKFKAHLYRHNAVESRYKCEYCLREFYRKDSFKAHMETHGGNKPQKVFICDDCDRCFVMKRSLLLHLKVHDDNLRYQYECVACGVSYCEQRLLKYHIRKAHYNLKKDNVKTENETNNSWYEKVKNSEVCVKMTQLNSNTLEIKKFGTGTFQSVEDLKVVSKDGDPKTQFKDFLGSTFAKNFKTQYSKAECDYCHKQMLKKSLISHIRERHLKIKRFKCEECLKCFSRHYQLIGHVCGKQRKTRKSKC